MPRHATVRRHNVRRGLTLIEILIVIAILLALGGLVVMNLMPAREQADVDLTTAQIDRMSGALEQFRLHLRRYPTEEEGLAALWNRDVLEDERDMERWRGPYIDVIREDTWGSEWIYRYPGEIRGERYYDLVSPGPDREEGTDDDITNHDRLRGTDGEIESFDFDDM